MTLRALPGGARWWTCSACGHVGAWGPGWRWLGRLEPMIVERVLCPSCPDDRPAPHLPG